MDAIAVVKTALIRAGIKEADGVECPQCQGAIKLAMEMCEHLNTPQEFHTLLIHRKKEDIVGEVIGKHNTYRVTSYYIAVVYERLRVLWKIGPVSNQAMFDVTAIIDGVVSRN